MNFQAESKKSGDEFEEDKYAPVHIVYPDGLKIPEHMMDPNIGGYKPKKSESEK